LAAHLGALFVDGAEPRILIEENAVGAVLAIALFEHEELRARVKGAHDLLFHQSPREFFQ
jgi:hypothetical protein